MCARPCRRAAGGEAAAGESSTPTPGFQPQQPGVQMQQVPMAQAQAMPMQQGVILGQQPTGVIQQPQAQPGPILTGTVVSAAPPTKSNIAL